MTAATSPEQQLRAKNAELRAELEEAEETLRAIRCGEVEALVVETAGGLQLFTLQGLDAESNRSRGEILAQVSDAVIAVDAEERVTYLNAAAERQYRVSASDTLGRQLKEIYTRRWPHAEAEGAMWAVLREHGQWRGEMIHHTHDGREIAVETSVTALCDASGAPAGYVRVFHDITERKEIGERLRAAHDSFRHLVEHSPFGIYAVDADFRLVQVSAGAQKVFENVRPLLGRDFAEVLRIVWSKPFVSEAIAIFRQVLETGKPYHAPGMVKQRQDIAAVESYDWKVERIILPDGRPGVVCHFYDLSERQRYEARLVESEERTRLATEATAVGIWERNVNTGALRWDAQMFRIYGIAPTADGLVEYGEWSGAVLPEDLPESERILQDTVRTCGHSRREFRIRRREDGQVRDIEAVETVRTNQQGQAEWVLGTNLDITGRKRSEDELRASEERMATMNEQLIVSSVRQHELTESAEKLNAQLLSEITERKKVEEELRASKRKTKRSLDYAEATLRTTPVPFLVLRADLRVNTASEAFYTDFKVSPAETEGRLIYEIGNGQWNIPKLRELLEEIIPKKHVLNGFEVTHGFATIGTRTMLLNARRMDNAEGVPERILLAIEDITERRQSEEMQARLGAIISSADDGILSKALDGTVTTWNASAERLLGYTAEEIIGNPNLHLTPPELLHDEEKILEQILAGKAVEHLETQLMTKDGRRLPVSLTISPIMDATGKVIGASKIVRDITERKRAEEILRASQERFRAAAGAMSDIIWTNDAEGRMDGEQPGWIKFTGQTLEEYQGHGWIRAVHPDDAQPTLDAWNAAVADKRMFEFEHRVRRHDGAWRTCSVRVVPVSGEDGGIREWVGVHNDITERKGAEENAAYQTRLLEALTESVLDGILIVSLEGKTLHSNQRFLKIWNFPSSVLEKQSDEEALQWAAGQTADPAGFLSGVATAYKTPDKETRDELLMADGRVYERCGSPVRIDGTPMGWVWTFRDTTERRAFVENLRLAKEQAESASRAKDDFLAALSHELRTPLTPVLMTASALEGDPAMPTEVREQFSMMRRNIELEARLIDDLLDLTTISRGKLHLAPVVTDLHALLGHTNEIIRSDSLGKKLRIVFSLKAGRHHALVDPTRIQQVFWNLLKNAVKFTPGGGSISVSTVNDEDGGIVISVKDSGIGMGADTLPHIFNAFEQGAIAGQHSYGGLGLGLAISQAIVTAHDGAIRAESEGLNCGSTLTAVLRSTDAPATPVSATEPGVVPARSLKLLIVEDHEATRQVLERLLSIKGHRVTTAATVRDALAIHATERFDAVISDLGLPDGSGLDLMRELQRQRPVPGIALSGYGMEGDLRLSSAAGFFAHLVKPVNLDQLRQLIDQIPLSSP